MQIKLPVLTREVDCEPIGYPGVVVTYRLNLPYEKHEYPWDVIKDQKQREQRQAEILEDAPWESEFYYYLSRIVESVTLPAEVAGEETVIETPDAKAIYDLMFTPGFDQQIIIWSQVEYSKERQTWLESEVKN